MDTIEPRDLIIRQIKERLLKIERPDRRPTAVEFGIEGINVKVFPSIFCFEDMEENKLVKPGVYHSILPVWIEYYDKVKTTLDIYPVGRSMLTQIRKALELDYTFIDLCVNYSMASNQILERADHAVAVVVLYKFTYTMPFFGQRNYC